MGAVPEPPAGTFAGLLRQLRTAAGLTQEQLAAAAGLSPRSISDLERGVNLTARRETVRLIADVLNLTGPARAGFQAAARGLGRQHAFPAGGTAAATRTLPRDTGAFTGRQSELGTVLAVATSAKASGGIVSICAIDGMAGIGKTTFAVHAAHHLAPRFPDGQVFLPLHAHTPGQRAVDPADGLASLLLTAGVDASQIPAGLEERTRLWRDHLAGKQVLLLLDDAAGYEQVRPLLPGTAGSFVLVTSRRHLSALEDADTISLDTLPPGEAAALLVRLSARPGLTADDPAVREIAGLCGYLPLAIGMLAGRLRHHPAWSAAELASGLASARDRLEFMHTENLSVAAAFDLSYQDLEPAQQRLFRRLGWHCGPDFDAYAAAALDDAELSATRRRLEALYDQHLLTEHVSGRYRLHDLVREHARSLAASDPGDDGDAARDRLLSYYLQACRVADQQLARRGRPAPAVSPPPAAMAMPDLTARKDAIGWIGRERFNLHAAVSDAVQRGRPAFAIALPAAMHAFLRFQGYWDQALALHRIALDSATSAGGKHAQAQALTDLGDVEMATRDYPAAAASLSKAITVYRELADRPGEAAALTELGAALYLTGENQAAAGHLVRALELYRDLGGLLGEAVVLSRLGSVRLVTGDYQAATAGLTRALELYRNLGDRLGEAHALNDLGAVRQATGAYAEARADLERALELYRDLGDRLGEANALLDLGNVQHATGDYPAAIAGLTRALDLYRDLDDRLGRANALHQLGAVRQATGDHGAAAGSQQQALDLYRQLGDRGGEADALIDLAEASLESGQPAQARARFEQALAIAADIASPLVQARAAEGIGKCDLRDGETEQGAVMLRNALAIYTRLGSPRARSVTAMLADLTN
jgi:tetratricopeptide (TPR) repeat protein/transcriptional regulator with XRE-family HTH domain